VAFADRRGEERSGPLVWIRDDHASGGHRDGHAEFVSLSRRKNQTATGPTTRWSLPAAVKSEGGRSGGAVDPLYPVDEYRGGIPFAEERSRTAPDPPSAGAARGSAHLRGIPRLLFACNAEEQFAKSGAR